jgi:hypothetical protein
MLATLIDELRLVITLHDVPNQLVPFVVEVPRHVRTTKL